MTFEATVPEMHFDATLFRDSDNQPNEKGKRWRILGNGILPQPEVVFNPHFSDTIENVQAGK